MAAVTAAGTTISIDGGTTTVGSVVSISAPAVSVATIDSTDFDSTWRTFIGGLKDGGECSFSISYDPSLASHTAIETAIDGTSKSIEITWSDATTMTFSAIITGFSASAAIDDKLTCDVSMKVTSAVTF